MNFLSTKKGNKKNYSETTNDGLKLDSRFFGLRTVQNSSRGAACTLSSTLSPRISRGNIDFAGKSCWFK